MTIDGNTIQDPQGLKEYRDYARTDNYSLNHSMQRNELGRKKVAELTWTNILPDELALILAWADDLAAHAYSNLQSKYGSWEFTGIVTILEDGNYVRGGSFMQDTFTVRIREA